MKASVVGAGVIGCGWAVRFALFGWDVAIYDADPQALGRATSLLEQVQPHVLALYEKLPNTGRIEQVTQLPAALDGAAWVQESLPEDLQMKRQVYVELSPLLKDTLLCSSTSGFRPSMLATPEDPWSDRFLVCHPFNPVYLLPLVEVVAAAGSAQPRLELAQSYLTQVGMHPLVLRKEIDAHVADRLLEAVWREALWMIKDGVATTTDIDQAITHGFGLRWAQMGLFETYRLGGGEAGMQQFLQQFGPALQWPWSRLTDVPELDAELVQMIVEQSDRQSGDVSISELMVARDANLVALLSGLKQRNWGAGKLFNTYVEQYGEV